MKTESEIRTEIALLGTWLHTCRPDSRLKPELSQAIVSLKWVLE